MSVYNIYTYINIRHYYYVVCAQIDQYIFFLQYEDIQLSSDDYTLTNYTMSDVSDESVS